jgi:ribosomal protein S18 acetylase RimI-like enzyme
MAELERAWEFECALQDRFARSRTEFELGTALFDDSLRRVYDANFVRFERGFDELTGASVEAAADALQASMRHRKVVIPDEQAGARVAEELKGRGWRYYTLVTMAYRGADPARVRDPAHQRPVEEVDPVALRSARERALDDGRRDAEARRQIVAFTELMAAATPTRLFAARADRHEIGSFCALFQGEGIGQIDEVTTVEQYQRRGLAAAVVRAAVRASLQDGDELTFLVADEADWPKDWYARLGFEPVGRRYELLRA